MAGAAMNNPGRPRPAGSASLVDQDRVLAVDLLQVGEVEPGVVEVGQQELADAAVALPHHRPADVHRGRVAPGRGTPRPCSRRPGHRAPTPRRGDRTGSATPAAGPATGTSSGPRARPR